MVVETQNKLIFFGWKSFAQDPRVDRFQMTFSLAWQSRAQGHLTDEKGVHPIS